LVKNKDKGFGAGSTLGTKTVGSRRKTLFFGEQ